MQVKKIKCELFIQDVPNHQTHKKILLDLIDKFPNNPYENVTKTDWNLPKKFKRKYLDYFYPHISKSLMTIFRCITKPNVGGLLIHGFNSMKKILIMNIIIILSLILRMFILWNYQTLILKLL